ncbi:hypothetical protein F5887DRAFT_961062 [Amanita rubescens]|nr:hypothetical protein F5887DRAFT_961062 [Amanita rubescens]
MISARSSKAFIPIKANLLALLGMLDPAEQDKIDLLVLTLHVLGLYPDMYKGPEGFVDMKMLNPSVKRFSP